MPDYRVYCFDGKNRIAHGEWIEAADDAAALAYVEAKQLRVRCEVWLEQRMVGEIPPHEAIDGLALPVDPSAGLEAH